MAFAIRTEGLTKSYRIGQGRSRYDTLRDDLARLARAAVSPRSRTPARAERVFALRDVSVEIGQGEVVGIIGRNGSGKTTFLRILSRITVPDSGYADVRGRVGSLLEVGTGFHPELTGRENIFLNGAVHGMRRSETARKFDEIVEFAGVEKFVDTPVKRYSSGMYVRLAFSVAAHLEPQVMLVDEVLAVGDAEFQKRCLGKLDEIGKSGRTVLFVSHSMPTVTRLCERVLLLDGGRLVVDGAADDVVAAYLSDEFVLASQREWPELAQAPGDDLARLRSLRVVDRDLATVDSADVRSPVGVEIVFDLLREGALPVVPWLEVYNEENFCLFSAMDTSPAWRTPRPPGRYRSVAWIPENLLNEGAMVVSVSVRTLVQGAAPIRHADAAAAVGFLVYDPGTGETARGAYGGHMAGFVRPLLEWDTEVEERADELRRSGLERSLER